MRAKGVDLRGQNTEEKREGRPDKVPGSLQRLEQESRRVGDHRQDAQTHPGQLEFAERGRGPVQQRFQEKSRHGQRDHGEERVEGASW